MFNVSLSKFEKTSLLAAFPGKEGGCQGVRINISRIFDQKYNIMLNKLYNKVDMNKLPDKD